MPDFSRRAYVLSIGSELVQGHLTDTNATYLTQELVSLGIETLHVIQVGDQRDRIRRTLEQALTEADVVICTGGIGPTEDDLTREAIADLVGETPKVQDDLLEDIQAFFRARGLEMPARNAKQAWMIESAESLPNPVGTAPGWFVRHGSAVIATMPGVPREMFRMWTEQVRPRLAEDAGGLFYRSVTLRTVGIGESALEDSLRELVAQANPIVATYAKDDGVQIRVTGIGNEAREAIMIRDATVAQIESIAGPQIYGRDGQSLAAALIDRLQRAGMTLWVSDLGSAGAFLSLLGSEPHASQVLLGGDTRMAGNESATDLAEIAARRSRSLGMGVVVSAKPDGPVWSGEMAVALSGPVNAEERSSIRAAFAEIERRSALLAGDVLHRHLPR